MVFCLKVVCGNCCHKYDLLGCTGLGWSVCLADQACNVPSLKCRWNNPGNIMQEPGHETVEFAELLFFKASG